MAKRYRVVVDGQSKTYPSQRKAYDDAVPEAKAGKAVRVYEKDGTHPEVLFETFNTGNHDQFA
jgi:hypothetical protein